MTWIEALRVYNAGMPSWCVPRKGTSAYDTIVKLRRGEKTETPKEIIDRLEQKTTGKPKKVKRVVRIKLDEPMKTERIMEKSVEKGQEMTKEGTYKYSTAEPEEILELFEGTSLLPAIQAYQEYITKENESRERPIRAIEIKVSKDKEGKKVAVFSHPLKKEESKYLNYGRGWVIEPEFRPMTHAEGGLFGLQKGGKEEKTLDIKDENKDLLEMTLEERKKEKKRLEKMLDKDEFETKEEVRKVSRRIEDIQLINRSEGKKKTTESK